MEQKKCINLTTLCAGALGLLLIFAGLASHSYTVIRPAMPFIAYGAAAVEEQRTPRIANRNVGFLPGLTDVKFLIHGAPKFESIWIPPKLIAYMKQVFFTKGSLADDSMMTNMIMEHVNEVKDRTGLMPRRDETVNNVKLMAGYWAVGDQLFAKPKFVYLAFVAIRAQFIGLNLGVLVTGLVMLGASVVALVVFNRNHPGIWRYAAFGVSVVIVCAMFFVMKVACDGILTIQRGDIRGAVLTPLVFMMLFLASACTFLIAIPRFAGNSKSVNITAKFLLILALLLGCLFFPCGVWAGRNPERFQTGLCLLFSSFVFGVIGATVSVFGWFKGVERVGEIEEVKPLVGAA